MRKITGFFIITFILLALLSLISIFYTLPSLIWDKEICILLGLNFLILLAFFFRKHIEERWLKVTHRIIIAFFSLALIIYLLIFLINQFYELPLNLNYVLIGVFALGLLGALSYSGKGKVKVEMKEKKIKADWLIYFIAIIVSAIISAIFFSKLQYGYGFLTYFIPAISFVILSFLFVILTFTFIRNKAIAIKKDYVFVAFLALAGGILVFLKTKELGWPAYLIAIAVCALIVLVSVLLLEDKEEKKSPVYNFSLIGENKVYL